MSIVTFIKFYPLICALFAMLLAQSIKLISNLVAGRFSATDAFTAGGMPSSHTALVSALTMGIGLQYGFHNPLFFICLVFSMVVIHDAAGIRRSAGHHAQLLNRITETMSGDEEEYRKASELLGHTPLEVAVGICIGFGTALMFV